MPLSGSLTELTPDPAQEGGTPPAARAARRRAVAAWALLSIGIALGLLAAPLGVASTAYLAAAATLGAVGALAPGRRTTAAALALAAVASGAGLVTLRAIERPARAIDAFLPDGSLIEAEGLLLREPEPTPEYWAEPGHPIFRDHTWSSTLALERARTPDGSFAPFASELFLRAGGEPAVHAGDRVRVTGRYRAPEPAMNPGQRDARLWWAQRGVLGSVTVPGAELIERVDGGSRFVRAREALRARCRRAIGADDARTPAQAVLVAVTLGERGPGFEQTARTYRDLGVSHLLAISGFHLVVMAGALLAAIRLTGDRGWLEPAIVALVVLAYLSVAPVRPAVLRAGILVLAVLVGEALGRRHDRAGLIAWTGIALLIWRPMDLLDLGYQLTFGLTLALATLAPAFDARLWRRTVLDEPPDGFVRTAAYKLQRLASAGIVCWLVATPLLAYHTGQIGPLGWLVTLILLPVFVPMIWIGFAAMLLGAVWEPLGDALRPAGVALAEVAIQIGDWLSVVPGARAVAPPISAPLAAAGVVLAVALLRCRLGVRTAALACVVAVWFGAEWRTKSDVGPGVLLRIDTLAVGDGTCHLIRSGSDALLWDCGSMNARVGAGLVPGAVRALGRRTVPGAVVTHANTDHYNGLLLAGESVGLRTLRVGPGVEAQAAERPEGPAAQTLDLLRAAGVAIEPIARGATFNLGSARVAVLNPNSAGEYATDNDRSLVALFEVQTDAGPRRLLMTGDIQAPAMRALEDLLSGLEVDVLELPHHGSAHEGAYEFVRALSPEVVLQSTGPSRVGDERWDGVRAGVDSWLVTARDGALWAEIGRDGAVRSGSFRGP